MKISIMIDTKVLNIINTAFEYKHIKRVGVFNSYAKNAKDKLTDLDLIYDCDDADELLEYIEDVDMLLRHITGLAKIGFIQYKDIAESGKDIIWIHKKQ